MKINFYIKKYLICLKCRL